MKSVSVDFAINLPDSEKILGQLLKPHPMRSLSIPGLRERNDNK